MLRVVLISASLVAAPLAVALPAAPVLAAAAAVDAEDEGQCKESVAKKRKKSMFGSIVGSVAGHVADRAGLGSVGGVPLPTSELLSEAITALLDCKEQQQAARATDEAVRGGVGTTSTWESESRPNVSGRSTVTAEAAADDGSHCLTVTDVVIVDGEETTVPKKMCRKPGQARYARV